MAEFLGTLKLPALRYALELNNTGAIDVAMLTSDCAGLDCRGSYAGGPVTAN